MALFSQKQNFLGVDIGTASIKLVELAPFQGKPRLVTYGYADVETDIIHSRSPEIRQKVVSTLKKVVASSRATTNLAIGALPTFSVFNSIISLPPMAEHDLAAAIKWEAKKYVPLPLEEMILDWKILKEVDGIRVPLPPTLAPEKKPASRFSLFGKKSAPEAEGKKRLAGEPAKDLRVLVTAAPQNLVSYYLEVFKGAGLKLLSLETEAFALARSLIGADRSTVMIVDIGSITTDICIIEKGVPVLNRSIDVGGLTLSKAIAEGLNINLDRAEQFKRDIGMSPGQDAGQKGINKTIATALSPIVNEIKYVFNLYQSQQAQVVEKIVLSGGSAFLPDLTAYFQNLFNKPAIIGNPWDKVVYPEELKPALDEVGSRLAVAIGLAMRDIK